MPLQPHLSPHVGTVLGAGMVDTFGLSHSASEVDEALEAGMVDMARFALVADTTLTAQDWLWSDQLVAVVLETGLALATFPFRICQTSNCDARLLSQWPGRNLAVPAEVVSSTGASPCPLGLVSEERDPG